MPYTIPAITTPICHGGNKSHTAISEWQIHTQEHSWLGSCYDDTSLWVAVAAAVSI